MQNIAITLDSSRLSEPLMSQIAILTDISEEPEALLRVRANIKAVLAFKPALISAGQIAKDASFSGRASLVGTLVEQGKLKNLKIETSTAAIDVEDIASPNYRRGVFLKFVLKPELKAGTFKETITLISENPPIKAVLEILGQKLGIIKVTPDRFSFFPKKGKRPKKLDIIFECEKVFKITKLEDLSGALDLSIKTLEKGRKYRLRAKLKKIPEGGILSVVKVHTDLEEHPLIHIPVIGGGER
ncbi:MAG: hypothetical protein PVH84_12735 [Candidatus Aminicenantes bacterium]